MIMMMMITWYWIWTKRCHMEIFIIRTYILIQVEIKWAHRELMPLLLLCPEKEVWENCLRKKLSAFKTNERNQSVRLESHSFSPAEVTSFGGKKVLGKECFFCLIISSWSISPRICVEKFDIFQPEVGLLHQLTLVNLFVFVDSS